jgi:malate permease and related proteins
VAHYLTVLGATLAATGPIFFLILLGIVLKRFGLMDDRFIAMSSRLVFTVCLPVLLFTTIIKIDLSKTLDWSLVGFSLAATIGAFLLSWLVAMLWVNPRSDRGVFVQGAFRGNLAVIGIALAASAYGESGLAIASLLMAAMTILYNILAVIVLSFYADAGSFSWRSTLKGIAGNPLILSIVAALIVAALRIPLPDVAINTGSYLGSMALPLAVLGSGAGLSLSALTDSSYATGLCLALKLAVIPLVFTVLAWWLGFEGSTLGVVFLLLASPTAAASFVMAQSMGGNATLAANIVMTTTLGSIVTTSVGLFVLKASGIA